MPQVQSKLFTNSLLLTISKTIKSGNIYTHLPVCLKEIFFSFTNLVLKTLTLLYRHKTITYEWSLHLN